MDSSKASLLGLQMAAFSLCPYMTFSLGVHTLVSLPLLTRTVSLLQAHLTLTTSLKALCPNIVTLGVKTSTSEFWGIQFSP